MNFERLLDDLRNDEGFRADVYQCTMGRWSIGYGSTYVNGSQVTAATPTISHRTAMDLLMSSTYGACIDAQGIFSNFDNLDAVRQETLVNMAYNLGGRGLALFVKMRACVENRDFQGAAREMRDSNWFDQVAGRGMRLYLRMVTGVHN